MRVEQEEWEVEEGGEEQRSRGGRGARGLWKQGRRGALGLGRPGKRGAED